MATFNAKEHMMNLQGKDYLPVAWRIVWFREENPTGSISTELVGTEAIVIVRAVVSTDAGLLSTGYGTAPAAGKGSWTGRAIEKAETAAIGRALAHAGYGTQFTEDEEDSNLADSPVSRQQTPTPEQQNASTPLSSAANGSSESVASQQFEQIPSAARLTKEDVQRLSEKWGAESVNTSDILKALGVPRAGLFHGDYATADARIKEWHNAQLDSTRKLDF